MRSSASGKDEVVREEQKKPVNTEEEEEVSPPRAANSTVRTRFEELLARSRQIYASQRNSTLVGPNAAPS